MSARMDEFEAKLQDILNTPWDAQDARVVPKTQDVKQKDGAKRVEATYLYADLADSTLLSKKFKAEFAARVIRSYLRIAVVIEKLFIQFIFYTVRDEGGLAATNLTEFGSNVGCFSY